MPGRTNIPIAPNSIQSPLERAIQRWEGEGGEIPVLQNRETQKNWKASKVTLFSRFQDPAQAERALTTLIHRGGKSADLTLISPSGCTVSKLSPTNSVVIPGLGTILGGGPLASALAGVDAPHISAALSSGVASFLHRHGVPTRVASDTTLALLAGDAVLMIACPTGNIPEFSVTDILSTYQGQCYGRADASRKEIYAI